MAGVTYGDGQEILARALKGHKVTLEKEPDNEFDKNAVKVLIDGEKVGYLPKEIAEYVCPSMVVAKTRWICEFCGGNYGMGIDLYWRPQCGVN